MIYLDCSACYVEQSSPPQFSRIRKTKKK
uniref:Uncharacterized protein n=1 Tax=Nelumbo nucifera TaxID=4432 RepID=A0A822Y075_NELNU|nr:TPA_asm: hypothetical protein HUJ06_026874 [Nelumbo nucifera]DAD25413.1 TPA_asm: hypothetical protein HUJ06_026877 [Nelumbo nucifera]